MNRASRLLQIAQQIAAARDRFFEIKGPSVGDHDTLQFMAELRRRSLAEFGSDFAEQTICGENRLTVDYYFPEEETIVEVALGLRNPTSEFERDVLKAIMAQDSGQPVRKLLFISKPGGLKRCSQPGARAIIAWAARAHKLEVEILELNAEVLPNSA
jgi:hypothetical protein